MVATTTMRTQDYCMLGVLVLVAYVWTSLWLRRAQTVKRPLTQLSVEFRRFQRSYVAAFVLALLCEYGQASQTFALLRHSHGEDYGRIAMVYASGFAATWLTTAARGTLFRFSDDGAAAAAKNEVVCCFAGYFVASLLASKEDWGLAGVAASRVVAGCALPLLQSSFDSWMRRAHAGLGFPAAWRRSTYELAGAGTTAASIFSGVLVEIARRRYHERRAFEVTSVVAALGLAVVAVSWPKRAELYSSDEGALASKKTSGSAAEAKGLLKKNAPHVRGTCRQGLMTLGRASTSAAAVALAACLFESCAYVTNATWATTLARIHDRDDVDVAAKKSTTSPYYGVVFALLMASAVVGTHVFQIVASKPAPSFEGLALALCGVSFVAFAKLAFDHAAHRATRAAIPPLLVFQLAVGCSVPTFASLRGKFVQADLRGPIANAANLGHGILVLALVLLVPANTQLTFALLATCMAIALAAVAYLLFLAPREKKKKQQSLPPPKGTHGGGGGGEDPSGDAFTSLHHDDDNIPPSSSSSSTTTTTKKNADAAV